MKNGLCCIAAGVTLAFAGVSSAGRPSMDECFEGADFIGNAALSRDAGMTGEAFLDRMEQDFVLIQAFPNELRWFVHDSDDESFLLHEARDVFDHPGPPDRHRRAFLHACVDRIVGADNSGSEPQPVAPAEPLATPGRT
jgi:hypothetical protein